MKKVRSLISLLCVLGVASAQTQSQISENRILSAYSNLRALNSVYLHLIGNTVTGSTTDTVDVKAFYKLSPATPSTNPPDDEQIDLQVTRNDATAPSLRLIGDGKLLRSYDYDSRRYWVAPYAHWSATNSGKEEIDHSDFMEALGIGASAESSYIARLLREVFGDSSDSYYTRWLPGVDPTDGATDPLTSTSYDSGVTYTLGDPAKRKIGFLITEDETSGETSLTGIAFTDVRKVGGKDRETNWTLYVITDLTQVPTELDFAPPAQSQLAGWRQIVRPVPVLR